LKPQIIIYNEDHVEIGATFPRRAKQLVNSSKAKWTDASRKAIIMLAATMSEQYEDLLAEGIDKDRAMAKIEGEYWDVQEMIKGFSREKSFVKDTYRENVSVVVRSTPFEIIKRSKKQTRVLHITFSAVLWSGALLIYLIVNYLLGNMYFTLDPERLSGTWLIFAFALLIECSVEIYFSKKELEVLSENIDLRQINPNNRGDLDLRGYQRRLTRKIRVMTHAVVWIPLVLLFFVVGYSSGRWNIIGIVLLFGVFVELLLHFISRLNGMKNDGYGISGVKE